MTTKNPNAQALVLAAGVATVLLAPWSPVAAQYKVVAPDGSVTYTDRPPADTAARITPMSRSGAPGAAGSEPALPAELRQPAQRFPVVLYASAECAPCDTGRRLLQQRGIPYTERHVVTEDDAQALERLSGGRTLPALMIGGQSLRGFSEADWSAYLDAAGYPRQSRLPGNWPVATPRPMTERAAPPAGGAAPVPRATEPRVPAEATPEPGGLRF